MPRSRPHAYHVSSLESIVHVTISNLEFMYIDRQLICDVNLLKRGNSFVT